MGQVWSGLQDTFKHHISEDYLNRIIDTIFDSLPGGEDGNTRVPEDTSSGGEDGNTPVPEGTLLDSEEISTKPGKKCVTYDQLYQAIVEVYKQINQIPGARMPGAFWTPPSKPFVIEMLKKSDIDNNQQIDREEFRHFVRNLSSHLVATYMRDVLIVTLAVPAAATLTKRATRGVPIVGGLLSKVPNTVFYASASAVALFARNRFFRTTRTEAETESK